MTCPLLAIALLALGQMGPSPRQDAPGRPEPSPSPPATEAGSPPSAPDMGTWLVNQARHQGHLVGRADPRSAALHVMALLSAAKEASPHCADAWYWLYDLNLRLGRRSAALEALAEYVKLAPSDDGAAIRRLQLELDQRQTAESRTQFVRQELQRKPLTPVYESELATWLGKYAFEGGDRHEAGQQIERALRLNPMNVPARRLAYEMFGETEPELQRVEMGLQMISINPSQVNLVWDLAEFLDRLSLHKQAQEWYNRAIDLHRRAEAGAIPAELWQKLAISYMCGGDYAKAKEAADAALDVDPSFHAVRLLRANAEGKLGDAAAEKADQEFVKKAYEARIPEVTDQRLADEAAQLAWYFAYHRPDKEQALKLAELAVGCPRPSALARLAHGYALSINGRTDDAIKALQPLAESDQLAALELARCRLARGDKAQAMSLLHKAAAMQYSGIAYNLIRDELAKLGETASEPPLHAKVVAVLDKFQRDVFDYYRRTGDFLKFTLRLARENVPIAGPLEVVLRLENVGPFSITFGEGFMARPLIAISATVDDGEPIIFQDYLQALMSSRPVLIPGDAVEKVVAIDVGPFRERLLSAALRDTQIEIVARFDPVYQEGKLASGLGTLTAGPITASRKGFVPSPAAISALADEASSGQPAGRIAVADTVGALLAAAEKHQDAAQTVPLDDLRRILAKLLADRDWQVRARAVAAADWSTLDATILTRPSAQLVQDPNPIVRLLTVRLFAGQQGEAFKEALEHISKSDPDQSVRTLAKSFLPETADSRRAEIANPAVPP